MRHKVFRVVKTTVNVFVFDIKNADYIWIKKILEVKNLSSFCFSTPKNILSDITLICKKILYQVFSVQYMVFLKV